MAISWHCPDCGLEIGSTGYGVVGERIYVDRIRVHERTHTSAKEADESAQQEEEI